MFLRRVRIVAWAALFSAAPVYAQTQAEPARQAIENQEKDAQDAKLKAEEAAKKAKPAWTGSVTVGTQLSQGETNAVGVSVQGDISKTLPSQIYRVFFIGQFASVRVAGVADRVIAQDRQELTLAFVKKFSPLVSFISQEVGERDRTKGLNYRAVSLDGIGLDVVRRKRVQLLIAPGFAFAEENKEYIRKGFICGPGVFQNINFAVSPRWAFNERVTYRATLQDTKDYILDASTSITGMIDHRFGVQASYLYTFEGVVRPGLHKRLSQLTIGLNIKI